MATTITLSFDANGGSGAPSSITFDKGDYVDIPTREPTRSGYTFSVWRNRVSITVNGRQQPTTCYPGNSYRFDISATLVAEWNQNPTLSYNANGGSGALSSQTVAYGATATVTYTVPTRTGYRFLGWSTSSTATTASYSGGSSVYMYSDVTLYAVWQRQNVLSYNANGGSGAPSSVYVNQGSSATVSSTVPTRSNYTFYRWNTSSSGSGTYYSGGSSISPSSDVTLYAIWNPQIRFSASGCANVPSTQTKTFGTSFTLPSTKPTKDGYAFVSWNTASDGSGTSYQAGGTIPASMNTTTTLYAIMRKTAAAPTISNIYIVRSDSTGAMSDDGGYAYLRATWSVDTKTTGMSANQGRVTGTITPDGGTTRTITFSSGTSGTSGTAIAIIPDIDTDTQYTVTITVKNTVAEAGFSILSTSRTDILTRAEFVMDFKSGGKAMGIGSAAPASGLEVGWKAQFDKDVDILGKVSAKNLKEYNYSSGLFTPSGDFGCSSQNGWSCWHFRELRLSVTIAADTTLTASQRYQIGTVTSGTVSDIDGHEDFRGYASGACAYGMIVLERTYVYLYPFTTITIANTATVSVYLTYKVYVKQLILSVMGEEEEEGNGGE